MGFFTRKKIVPQKVRHIQVESYLYNPEGRLIDINRTFASTAKEGRKIISNIPVWKQKLLKLRAINLREKLGGKKGLYAFGVIAGATASEIGGIVTTAFGESKLAKAAGLTLSGLSMALLVPQFIMWRKYVNKAKARRSAELKARCAKIRVDPKTFVSAVKDIKKNLKIRQVKDKNLAEELFVMNEVNPEYTEKAMVDMWNVYLDNIHRREPFAQKIAKTAKQVTDAAKNAGIKVPEPRGPVSIPMRNILMDKNFKEDISKSKNPASEMAYYWLAMQGIPKFKNVLKCK